jgi:hypothetical protein
LVCDERKVRIYREYFLLINRFILSIHDLTKTDLGKLDALVNRYLKFWLGLFQRGSFLPLHSGLDMDVKNVSHPYGIYRALIRGDPLFKLQCRPRFSMSRSGQTNLLSLSSLYPPDFSE